MTQKLLALVSLFALAACTEGPTEVVDLATPRADAVVGAPKPVGAIVLNRGAATEPFVGTCQFSGRFTNDVTIVATPNGGAVFKCHWEDFPAADYGKAVVLRGWTCDLTFPPSGFFGVTNRTSFVLSQSHRATVTCIFKETPIGQLEMSGAQRGAS